MIRETFQDRLVYLRKEAGLSQEQLAQQLSADKSTIAKYETGDRKPDIDTLIKIARVFHTSTDFLLAYDDFDTNA